MTTLNREAAEAMVEAGAEAATDVTGFGLLGHLREMLLAAGWRRRVDAGAVPFIPGLGRAGARGVAPGGTGRNHEFVDPHVDWGELDEPEQLAARRRADLRGPADRHRHPEALVAALERRVAHAIGGVRCRARRAASR